MGIFLIHSADAVTPSNFSLDLNTIPAAVANGKGPYMASLEMWLDQADAGAGGWSFDLQYDDPTATTTTLSQGAFVTTLSLSALPSYKAVPLFPFSRLSATSNYQLVGALGGPAGTSLVSYRCWLVPVASTDLIGF